MRKLGIVAGWGALPVFAAQEAAKLNLPTVVCTLEPDCSPELEGLVETVVPVDLGELDRLVGGLRERSVDAVLFAGKVRKDRLFSGLKPDARLLRLLGRLPELSDETIMQGVAEEFEGEGIKVLSQAEFLTSLLASEGVQTGRSPDPAQSRDAALGFAVAKQIAACGVGQTVVIKDRVVLAVEAVEGTDAAIRRGTQLGGPGATVVKVAKPRQDLRFDVPTVGSGTLALLRDGGVSCLAVEAGRTFIVERQQVLEIAQTAGISIIALGEASQSCAGI